MPAPTGDLSSIVKAYDVRGVVPDQLDERVAEALGAAFAQVVGAAGGGARRRRAATCGRRSPGLVAAFAAGVTSPGRRRHRHRARLDRPALLRQRQPRPARRDVHRQPQPGAVQRHQDVPRRRRPGRPGHRPRPRSARWPRPASAAVDGADTATYAAQDLLAAYADHLRTLVDLRGIRPLQVVVDAGNGMGGHTVPDRPRRAAARRRPDVLRARRHVPQPRGQPARPGEPRRPAGAVCARRRRHRARLRRRRRPLLRRRRARRAGLAVGGHRAGRGPRAGQAPGRHGDPQPDHLARGAGDRPRARRRAGADPGRALLHQGRDGPHRRGLRRRALRALLLPRLLARRHRHARGACTCWPRSASSRRRCRVLAAEFERYVASGEINCDGRRPGAPRPTRSAAAYARCPASRSTSSTADRAGADGWWFNLRASNTEPLLRLNVEAADRRDDGGAARRGARRDPRRPTAGIPVATGRAARRRSTPTRSRSPTEPEEPSTVQLDPQLLEILACPALPRRAARRRRRRRSWCARRPPAAWPTRSATTSRCC